MKNYIKGSAKEIETQYGKLLNISLNMEELQKLPQSKGYVKLTIAPRKEVGQYGETHSIFENDYKPSNSEQVEKEEDEALPF